MLVNTEKMVSKKAQDLSIGTLILIVLGIVVLVLLILGFTMGWDNLWDRINIFGGGASIGDVTTSCIGAIANSNSFAYCDQFHKIKVDGKTEYVNCEDDRVERNLDEKLNCPEGDEADRIKTKCLSLMKQGDIKKDTKVNTKICWEKYSCSDFPDYSGAGANGECSTGKIKLDKNDGVEGIGEGACCVPV